MDGADEAAAEAFEIAVVVAAVVAIHFQHIGAAMEAVRRLQG